VLAEVRKNGITQDELTRARTRYDTRMLSGLQSVGGFGGKADALQNYNHFVGEPDYLRKDLARYQALSTEDVKRYANEQLRPDMRVVLHAVPSQQAPTAPKETK
jgi:predicted Zn-dependent peptidase